LVGPSTAVTPEPGALPLGNGGAEEEKAMFSAGFCVARALAGIPQRWLLVCGFGIRARSDLFHNATPGGHLASPGRPRLKLRNESGTNQARIADSCALRLRSPQHLASSCRGHTRSSSARPDKPRFGAEFPKFAAHPESNQNAARVNRIRWCPLSFVSLNAVVPAKRALASASRDPYREIYREGQVADDLSNGRRWLWVPAFAGTTPDKAWGRERSNRELDR
jgi:hypothetical protein